MLLERAVGKIEKLENLKVRNEIRKNGVRKFEPKLKRSTEVGKRQAQLEKFGWNWKGPSKLEKLYRSHKFLLRYFQLERSFEVWNQVRCWFVQVILFNFNEYFTFAFELQSNFPTSIKLSDFNRTFQLKPNSPTSA